MFNFFKKKKPEENKPVFPNIADITNLPLQEGDIVESMRYNLGKCRIQKDEKGYVYESLESGEKVSWLRMVDAITGFQKVKKIDKSVD